MLDSILFDWNPIANKWENDFELMYLYKSVNGHNSVPRSNVTKEGVKLGAWVNMQRTNQDCMFINRISMLDSISFYWDSTVYTWESECMQLCLHKSMNGSNSVPRSCVIKEGVKDA